ncbi:hypothetical protein CU097_009885, partial [Rhizopus azygosporus]
MLNKIPLAVFGDGMKGKDAIRTKRQMYGDTGILYKEFQQRMKALTTGLVNINEYNILK